MAQTPRRGPKCGPNGHDTPEHARTTCGPDSEDLSYAGSGQLFQSLMGIGSMYDQLPCKQSVDGSNPSGGVSNSNGSWRKLGAVFILLQSCVKPEANSYGYHYVASKPRDSSSLRPD